MNELLQAAKDAIEEWDYYNNVYNVYWEKIKNLRTAVERAERQEAIGFEKWWEQNGIEWEWTILEHDAKALWTAAQQVERNRILDIINNNRDVFNEGGLCLILEKINSTE